MSKASYEKLQPSKRESFLIRQFDRKGFAAPFHQHPEYELTLIIEGKGKRYVGNHMSGFKVNDLVFLGAHLPHCWKLDQPKVTKAGSIVIQFTRDFLGANFFDVAEMKNIQKLLAKSQSGIQFHGKVVERVKDKIFKLPDEPNIFNKLMSLLDILNTLASAKNYNLLDQKNAISEQSEYNRERINNVFAYIVDDFQNEITLGEAAKRVNMTTNAFCKYFKKATRKTFIETVTDFRINFATQLLVESDKTIADICFESGFRDMSHFYKMFSSRRNTSPSEYRKQYLQDIEKDE